MDCHAASCTASVANACVVSSLFCNLQEIQECSTADAAPTAQPHPSQVLKLFWDRQAAAAAGSASLATASTATVLTASDPASSSMATTTTATAAGLLGGGASAGMRTGSGAAAAVAAATAAAAAIGGADAAVGAQGLSGLSRYRTDFEELIKLGQGGFGVVVAAVNRCVNRLVLEAVRGCTLPAASAVEHTSSNSTDWFCVLCCAQLLVHLMQSGCLLSCHCFIYCLCTLQA